MVRKVITYITYPVLIAGLVLGLFGVAYAAANIDSTNKWAWGSNVGWINFNPTHGGGVTVYSDHLEGYVWAENVGWIRLGSYTGGGTHTYANTAADNYGVNNDGSGNLSGYAWGENVGWIHFQYTTPYKVNTTWRGDLTGTYQTGVAAIIKDRATGPASSNGLTIANSSFLNDSGDGIIFGHDNGSGTTSSDCPSGVSSRWQRLWQFDVNDAGTTGGNVNLTFDFSDAGIGGIPSGDYTLLKRSGESGTFSGVATTSSIADDQVIFNNVNVSNLGSYFTLGGGTPTAVTLARFTARPTGKDLTGFRNLSGLGALVALGAVGGALLRWARRRRE